MTTESESIERTIRHFTENGGLHLTAYFECEQRKFLCTIDKSWEVHGVTTMKNELSFIASQSGQKPVKFAVRAPEFIAHVTEWFKKTAEKLTLGGCILEETIPQNFVFSAGVTELVPKKTLAAA